MEHKYLFEHERRQTVVVEFHEEDVDSTLLEDQFMADVYFGMGMSVEELSDRYLTVVMASKNPDIKVMSIRFKATMWED